jgi:hypothetical protein
MEQVGMKIKDEIIDIIKTDIDKLKLQVPFNEMYDNTAEKIMELFENDRQLQKEIPEG